MTAISILPTKPSEKADLIDPRSLILFGPAGVGKSTFGSTLSNALIIDTEQSTSYLSGIMAVDLKKISKEKEISMPGAWGTVYKELSALKGKMPYDYLILDTLDGFVDEVIFPYVAKQHNVKSITDIDYGAGYAQAKDMLVKYMNFFQDNFKAVIYMCHYKRTVFGDSELDFDMASLNFPTSIKTKLVHLVDEVGLFFSKNGNRQINFVGSDNMEGKSRSHHLSGKVVDAAWENIFIDKNK